MQQLLKCALKKSFRVAKENKVRVPHPYLANEAPIKYSRAPLHVCVMIAMLFQPTSGFTFLFE